VTKKIWLTTKTMAHIKAGVCPKCEEKIKKYQVVVKTSRYYYHFACYKKIQMT